MREECWTQCQHCGHLKKVKVQLSDDSLYIEEWCPKCRDETPHIWCGEQETDIYFYYNLNADPRYYNYNTK